MAKPNIHTVELAEYVIHQLIPSGGDIFLPDRNAAIYFLLDKKRITPELAQQLWGGTSPPPRPYKSTWRKKLGSRLILLGKRFLSDR